jgi:hypothetical protein
MIPGASGNQETQKYSFPWIARYLSARNLKHAKSKKRTKINPKLLSQCTTSWRIVVILSANLSIPLKTDLQPLLDNENRYVLER